MITTALLLALLARPTAPFLESGAFDLDTPLLPPFVVAGEELPPAAARSLRARMTEHHVPGVSIAVLRDGEIAWAVGLGVADARTGRPVTATTLFQAASISKPVAAVGALRLAQEGRLALDDDVNGSLRGWQVPAHRWSERESARPVTVRDLLSHTAGTSVGGFPGYPLGDDIPSVVEVLAGRGNTPPVRVFREPGTARAYSGGGYTIVQLLVDELVGPDESYAEWMRRAVLEPSGMRDSTFTMSAELAARAAVAHDAGGRALDCGWHVYPELAAAGLWTTPSDLLRFAATLQAGLAGEDGPVLSAASVRQMFDPPVEPGYGLGVSLDPGRFGHGGGNEGFMCHLNAFRSQRNGVVVMTNGEDGWELGSRIVATVFAREGWPGLEPVVKTVVAVPVDELERLAGTYRFGNVNTLHVSVAGTGDRLDFRLESGETGSLRPLSPRVFFETSEGSELEFLVDEDSGAITGARWGDLEATRG